MDRQRASRLVDVDRSSFESLPCCGIKNSNHPGRRAKCAWLEANAGCGLRAKTLLAPDGEPAGYIEYLPGEFAWRGVEAAGYLFIHCVWIYSRRHQGQGWGGVLVNACVDDARKNGLKGVAAMVREGPWMADRRLFLANGFEPADTAPPDFQLLVRKFDRASTNPSFKKGWDEKLRKLGGGLVMIQSSQCPHIAKFASDIAQAAEEEYRLKLRIVELQSWREAQEAPTPYAVFALVYNGRLLADHPVSRARFRNIMRGVRAGTAPRP